MSNQEIAERLYDIADMLEIEGVQWEPRAYRTAAMTILTLNTDVTVFYNEGRLTELEGIGKSISKSIEEYIKTGEISKYEKLKKKYPIDFESFRKVRGLGPKRAYLLYKKLGIKDTHSLAYAIEKHKIMSLEGFGEKSEKELAKNLDTFLKLKENRKPLGYVIDYIENLVTSLRKNKLFERVELAGSTRRMRDTVGDFDILAVSSNPEDAMELFSKMKGVTNIVVKGPTKTTVDLDIGLSCDIRIVKMASFGSAMQYFTGNKDHNIKLRKIAISKGLKLNEYGIFRGTKKIAGQTEEGVYKTLGLDMMQPELRENMGEVEASQHHKLPKIVEYNEILGDLHTHTRDSDGANSLEDLAEYAHNLGRRYIALTNHSAGLKIANGLDEERFRAINKKIDSFNSKSEIMVLKGVELEILKDGSLDLSNKILSEMDFVIGAIHQNLKMSPSDLTGRLIKAINSGRINAIAHPTDRMIGEREALPLNFDKVFDACEKNNVLIEINGFPNRSDLPFDLVKRAKEHGGIKFSLGSDAHRLEHLKFIRLSTAIARRGWLTSKDVVNTISYKDLLKLRR